MTRQANEPVRASSPDKDFRDRARELHERGDGEVEIDLDAVVSRGDDSGAYVQAWVWVPFGEQEGGVTDA